MELDKFKNPMDLKGWKVAPLTPVPDIVSIFYQMV